MRGPWTAMVLGMAVAAALAVADAQPQLPKLETDTPPPAGSDPGGGARALPPTVAVCRDAGTGRCWTAATAAECGGEPFRVVIDDPAHADAEAALAACRAPSTPH